jgi:hypothetical protein
VDERENDENLLDLRKFGKFSTFEYCFNQFSLFFNIVSAHHLSKYKGLPVFKVVITVLL